MTREAASGFRLALNLRNCVQPELRSHARLHRSYTMDLTAVAQVGLPAAGLVVYLFRHWFWPPGPESDNPLLAM